MGKIFYTSDLHLFHKNVTTEGTNFDNRPFKTLEEMHLVIKENWNKTVTNGDRIYILGDLAWKENDDVIAFVSTLKGDKHLILENHDSVKDARYVKLFNEVVPYKEIYDNVGGKQCKVILSHFPIAFWCKMHRESIHLYGHLHNTSEQKDYQNFVKNMEAKYGEQYIARNVGCMLWDYKPVTLKEILEKDGE